MGAATAARWWLLILPSGTVLARMLLLPATVERLNRTMEEAGQSFRWVVDTTPPGDEE